MTFLGGSLPFYEISVLGPNCQFLLFVERLPLDCSAIVQFQMKSSNGRTPYGNEGHFLLLININNIYYNIYIKISIK